MELSANAAPRPQRKALVLAALALALVAVLVWRQWPSSEAQDEGQAVFPVWPCAESDAEIAFAISKFTTDGTAITAHVTVTNRSSSPVRFSKFTMGNLVRNGRYAVGSKELDVETYDDVMFDPPPFAVDYRTSLDPGQSVVESMPIVLRNVNDMPAAGSVLRYHLEGNLSITDADFRNDRFRDVCGSGQSPLQ